MKIVGIDEVGRGPIAGPVGVGVFAIDEVYYRELTKKRFFKGIRDSKALTPEAREKWISKIHELNSSAISWTVYLGSSKQVDKKGVANVIREGIAHGLQVVEASPADKILLDGGIRAPKEFSQQKTIIKGDEKEVVIALASIFAKVTRDEYMIKLSKKYKSYAFEEHKGYGTKKHYKALKMLGITPEHRLTFL